MNKYPEYIMSSLRARLGLDEDDTSNDRDINQYNPKKALAEVLIWKFGYHWLDTIEEWANDCGLELVEKKTQKPCANCGKLVNVIDDYKDDIWCLNCYNYELDGEEWE